MTTAGRWDKLRTVTATRPYTYWLASIIVTYLALDVVINKLHVTAETFFTSRASFVIPFLLFTLIVAVLVGISINLVILKFRELRTMSRASGITAAGIFGGLLAGACPGCIVGLFPAFVGLFGISAGLGILPLFGLELQLISVALLLVAIFFLTRETTCKVDLQR